MLAKLPKHIAHVLVLSFLFFASYSQSGVWTWMNGLNNAYMDTQGIPSPLNVPDARSYIYNWTDTSGKFWIFGGDNGSDLWMYDPNTLMWTWMNGSVEWPNNLENVAAPKGIYNGANSPGSEYGGLTWVTQKDNHLWLYGGINYYSNEHTQLWQYDPQQNMWAWMGNFDTTIFGIKGIANSLNNPGARPIGNCTWVDDSDNLWFFGQRDSGGNDMWMYNPASEIWTWMSGSNNQADNGVYGLIGVPSVNNYPSSRVVDISWKDNQGNFWLAGGERFNYIFQDIWKFNPQTLEWTWVKGQKGIDTATVIGSDCTFANSNKIGPRNSCAVAQICSDLVIVYGGVISTTGSYVNDLWAYSISLNQWMRLNTWPTVGRYGTKGVPNILNYPPSREGAAGFADRHNNFWLYAGYGIDYDDDLWRYTIDSTCLGVQSCFNSYCSNASVNISAADNKICSNDSTQICAPTGFYSYQWNEGDSAPCIQAKAAGNYYLTAIDTLGCVSPSNQVDISTYPAPAVSITENGDTLTSFNEVTYQWYLNGSLIQGATTSDYVAHSPGSYYVEITDSDGCAALSNEITITGVENLKQPLFNLYPNPANDYVIVSYSSSYGSGEASLVIANELGQIVYSQPAPQYSGYQRIDVGSYASGVYTAYIKRNERVIGAQKFAKE